MKVTRKSLLLLAAIGTSILLGALGLALGLSSNWTPAKIEHSKEVGFRLLQALEQYREQHGEFPAHLGDLVPEYVDAIPPPPAGGGRWEYYPSSNDFGLSFGCGDAHYPSYYLKWSRRDKGWFHDH